MKDIKSKNQNSTFIFLNFYCAGGSRNEFNLFTNSPNKILPHLIKATYIYISAIIAVIAASSNPCHVYNYKMSVDHK